MTPHPLQLALNIIMNMLLRLDKRIIDQLFIIKPYGRIAIRRQWSKVAATADRAAG